jgi:hypothetical protein
MTAVDNKPDGPASRRQFLLVGAVFLLTRLVVLPFPQPASDTEIYAAYAFEQEAARREGVSFYEYHAREVERRAGEARAAGRLTGSIDEYKDVEYPPLAVAVLRLPLLWMGERPSGWPCPWSFVTGYGFAYRVGLTAVDAALLVLVVVLVRRLFAHESGREQTQRVLVYLLGTTILWSVLYDRLDLGLAFLIVLALLLLFSRLHYAWSFAVLALAINFKLVPLVLAPVWIVGSLPADRRWDFCRPRGLALLGARAAVLAVMVVSCFLPFYLSDGNRCLAFLDYHRGRGLEVGSVWGSLPLALQGLGHPVGVNFAHGCMNLRSSLGPVLVALAPWLSAGVLLAATALLLLDARGLAARREAGCSDRATLAQLHPGTFLCYTLLFLMLFIAANKVFSPQYLLWLVPLVCLIPFGRRGRLRFLGTFLLMCVLTTVVFPYLFIWDLVSPGGPPTVPPTIKDPTARLGGVLVIRNLLFVGLTAALAFQILRRARIPAGDRPGSAEASGGSGEAVYFVT